MVQPDQIVCDHRMEYRRVMTALYQKVTVIEWIREMRESQEQLSLSFLLHAFRHRQRTDEKDKVFAFLGLVPQLLGKRVAKTDYSRDGHQVLRTIFEDLLFIKKDLNLLVRQKEKSRRPELPTWMPDLTAEVESLHSDLQMYVMYHLRRFFDASNRNSKGLSKALPDPHKIELSSTCLSVRGLLFDEVLAVKEPDPRSPGTSDGASYMEILRSFNDPENVYDGDLQYSLWRLINFDQIVIETPQDRTSVRVQTRRIKDEDYHGHHSLGQPSEIMAEFLPLFLCFTTAKGYIGFGPHDMEKGDDVCLLPGASVPFVLRPIEGGEKHKFVGHCFVQGIMDSKALSEDSVKYIQQINIV